MKIIKIIIYLLLISFLGCKSRPEPNLELFSPEAFAFNIGDSWEVNSSVNVKGFQKKKEGNKFKAQLSYNIDLITPKSDSLVSIFKSSYVDLKEELNDIQLEAQIEIDTSFSKGEYKLLYHVTDELANKRKSMYINFSLTEN